MESRHPGLNSRNDKEKRVYFRFDGMNAGTENRRRTEKRDGFGGGRVKEIHYIQQPTEYLCGQACVAMIANVSVEDVIRVMNNDQATGKKDIERALDHYGIRQAKTMTKADNDTPLPPVCILKVLLPRYSHWVLFYHGKYYDPEFGLMDELYYDILISRAWE